MTVLADTGFAMPGASLFIWEGVTQYLTPEAVHGTFEQLRSVAAGQPSGLHLRPAGLHRRHESPWRRSGLPEVPEAPAGLEDRDGTRSSVEEILRGYGWRVVEQVGPSYYRDTYIRPTGRTISASPIEWTACGGAFGTSRSR